MYLGEKKEMCYRERKVGGEGDEGGRSDRLKK